MTDHELIKVHTFGPGVAGVCPCGWAGEKQDPYSLEQEYVKHIEDDENEKV